MSDRGFAVHCGHQALRFRYGGAYPSSSVASSAAGLFNGFFEWFGSLGIFSWQVLQGSGNAAVSNGAS